MIKKILALSLLMMVVGACSPNGENQLSDEKTTNPNEHPACCYYIDENKVTQECYNPTPSLSAECKHRSPYILTGTTGCAQTTICPLHKD